MDKPSDSKLNFIKVARALTYLVYAYALIAIFFLCLGFILLLFGANTDSSFVTFVYDIAAKFLEPFRGIFPLHQITDRSYFSASGLFAIIMYTLFAVAVHSLISYITVKQVKHETELAELQKKLQR